MATLTGNGTMIGESISHFRVLDKIGSGGMGDVYLAQDTTLDRRVALKFLRDPSSSPDLLPRFSREARLLATLNHPHIGSIYGVEEWEGKHYLVLELVEGDTLAERIHKGPLSPGEALGIGLQICDALAAAHEKGVIHRDLKPANIKISPQGTVKILDFGLAKGIPCTTVVGDSNAPTLALTEAGVTMGTPTYMSPEQAQGQPVDQRTDVWAFGCVLFEMLAGSAPFQRESTLKTLTAVLQDDPPLHLLEGRVPDPVCHLISRCLRKQVSQRPRDVRDLGLGLQEALGEQPVSGSRQQPVKLPDGKGWKRPAVAIALIFALGIGYVIGRWMLAPSQAELVPPLSLAVPGVIDVDVSNTFSPVLNISADGRKVVFSSRSGTTNRLYIRDLSREEVQEVPGSEGARSPLFSPDGRWVAFVAEGVLKKARVDGGAPLELGNVADRSNFSWTRKGWIYYYSERRVWRMRDDGRQLEELANIGPADNASVQPLPDGKTLIVGLSGASLDDPGYIATVSLETGQLQVQIEEAGSPLYVAGHRDPSQGFLFYARDSQLWGCTFDAGRLEAGPPEPLVDDLLMRAGGNAAQYAVSESGTLIYVSASLDGELVWVDGNGSEVPASEHKRRYAMPRVSPDGHWIAVEIQETPHQVWALNLERDVLSRLTAQGSNHNFAWSPRSDSILYTSDRKDRSAISWQPVGLEGDEEVVWEEEGVDAWVDSWSADGRWVGGTASGNVFVLPLAEGRPPRLGRPVWITRTSYHERDAMMSPDGRCVAYTSDETARVEVFVQCQRDGEWSEDSPDRVKQQISDGGADQPMWSRDGRKIFFRMGNRLMASEIRWEPAFEAAPAQMVLEGDYRAFSPANYDVAPDGRFLFVRSETRGHDLLVRTRWLDRVQKLLALDQ